MHALPLGLANLGSVKQIFKYYAKNKEKDGLQLPSIWEKHVGEALPFDSQSVGKSVGNQGAAWRLMIEDLQDAVHHAEMHQVRVRDG